MAQNGPEHRETGIASGTAGGEANGMIDEVKGAAQDVAEQARAAGASLLDQASSLGGTIKQGLSDQVEHQKNGIADRLSAVAERAQTSAGDLRDQEAWLGNLLGRGADELQGLAEEIRRNDVADILGSVEVFARRQPALFMGATVALGFALARFVGSGPTAADRYNEPSVARERDTPWQLGQYRFPAPPADIGSDRGRGQHLMTPTQETRSVGELLRDLASDAATLIRQELALARTEAHDKLQQTITAAVELVVGSLLAFAALIVLLDALVYGLTEAGLERWLAALIVGGVVAGIGFLLVRKGQNDLSATRLAPERTAASIRKDVNMVKEQVS